jgi:hypothetical protein
MSEPIHSQALARESAWGGICSAIVVFQKTSKSAKPTPVAIASGTTSTTVTPVAKATSITGQTAITRNAARMGWRGRQRKPITAPASAPAPYEAVTTPKTAVEL